LIDEEKASAEENLLYDILTQIQEGRRDGVLDAHPPAAVTNMSVDVLEATLNKHRLSISMLPEEVSYDLAELISLFFLLGNAAAEQGVKTSGLVACDCFELTEEELEEVMGQNES